jgi:hypothetical protein
MKKSASESERDEDHKRKREEGRESEERINPFRKSKKVERSPVKKAMDEEMKKMLEKIMEDVGEIKEENRKMSVLRTRFFIGWFVSSIYQATKLS